MLLILPLRIEVVADFIDFVEIDLIERLDLIDPLLVCELKLNWLRPLATDPLRVELRIESEKPKPLMLAFRLLDVEPDGLGRGRFLSRFA